MISATARQWGEAASDYFRKGGASARAAPLFATLYAALWEAGLQPRITSLFRDPNHQKAMQHAWDSGNRAGLRARPADPDTSRHCRTGWFSEPQAEAIDIVSNDETKAAKIAQEIGLQAGQFFTKPDPGHFQLP